MNKALKALILLLFSLNSYAEPFTVLAKSGLNVRKEPKSTSEKIGSLPFGTIVETDIDYETYIGYNRRKKQYPDVIEGKHGFWMKISQGKVEGYIFTGFGLFGRWVVNSTDVNKDYRILRIGSHCDPINYDPTLNWYALTRNNGKLSIKKSEVTLRLIHEFNEKDTLQEVDDNWREYPIIVQTNITDTVLYLIGSKTALVEGNIFSQFVAHAKGYSEYELLLFPEQTYRFYYEGKFYTFRAYEEVTLTNETPEGYIKKYQLELNSSIDSEVKKYNLSKELELISTAENHCNYRTPQLILVGDINSDRLPDFIYYSHTMTDGCGACWEYHLFLSDKLNIDTPIRKVAHEINCNCI